MMLTRTILLLLLPVIVSCSNSDQMDRNIVPVDKAPHIVVLIADDLGVGYAPCYAFDSDMKYLSSLCNRAAVFSRAYTFPLCTPSRSAMMSGRYTFRTHIGSVQQRDSKLDLSETTIPEFIREHSKHAYRFAGFGKWHLADNDNGASHNPNLQGFDHFEGNPRQHDTYRYFNYEWSVNGVVEEESVATYKTTRIVDRVLEDFKKYGSTSPQFYWVGFVSPHLPYHAPPKELHEFDDLEPPTFRTVIGEPKNDSEIRLNRHAPRAAPYFRAMTQALDKEIGRLAESIGAQSDRPVIFVFLGDNGTPGEVSKFSEPGIINAKATLYEGGVHVPLIIWSTDDQWGKIYASTEDRLVHLVDLFPTLAEMAGVAPAAYKKINNIVDGKSFADAVMETEKTDKRMFAYFQRGNERHPSFQFGGIDDTNWKLIIRNHGKVSDPNREYDGGLIEFFDLNNDVKERHNLFPKICETTPEKLWEIFEKIAALAASEGDPFGEFDVSGVRSSLARSCPIPNQ